MEPAFLMGNVWVYVISHVQMAVLSSSQPSCKLINQTLLSQPGVCHGNKDSCGNENRKSQEKIFFRGAGESTSILFSMKIKMMDL